MAWIESHQELARHPKTLRLARRLGVSIPAAIGHLQLLWWWAMDFAPDGSLAGFEAEEIALAVMWEGAPEDLLSGLVAARFVDEAPGGDGYAIHDWDDYAGRLIERRQVNAERMRNARAKHVQRTCRATVPDPTVPDPTVPDRTGPYPHPNLPATVREGLAVAVATDVPGDVISALSALDGDLSAAAFHAAAEATLTGLGFACRREVQVPDRGDGHTGRLDLLAERNGERIAFEFDRAVPRLKSVHKLATVEGAAKVVVTREPFHGPTPAGIDAVIGTAKTKAREGKPVLSGRNGWAGCPAGCSTNHGGPLAAKGLGGDWLALPATDRPPWADFLALHGRPDLADIPEPTPTTQEV